MNDNEYAKKILIEKLAAIEHERWSHWQSYLHSQCSKNDDGSLTIPSELVIRWDKQMNTDYLNLTNTEKESDREQVEKYFHLLEDFVSSSVK
ncbi:hypothetical protein I2F27_12540 [Acinetobacter sp. B5B]|uniref:hypothetical protein n=1 Tax=Acinetobacter baretiae TaxID=2605383 RepID=UPI0018C1F92E|nr:hypothetical protein [Acinetobacter baretiae]MBF7684117.1 hypothetical protein [Acinetobacter baretiae]